MAFNGYIWSQNHENRPRRPELWNSATFVCDTLQLHQFVQHAVKLIRQILFKIFLRVVEASPPIPQQHRGCATALINARF